MVVAMCKTGSMRFHLYVEAVSTHSQLLGPKGATKGERRKGDEVMRYTIEVSNSSEGDWFVALLFFGGIIAGLCWLAG